MATVTPPRTSHVHQNAHLLHVDPFYGTPTRRRPSFSVPDLDYKMKMMQLTLHFRAAASPGTGSRRSPSSRHSLGTFLRTEPAPGSVHQPKILAVEPKFKPVNAVKPCCSNPAKVLVSVKSATLPIVPQQTKVRRLVQLFEDGSGTTVRADSGVERGKQLRIKASIKVKPVQTMVVEEVPKVVQESEVIQQESITPMSTILVQQAIKRMSPEPVQSPELVKPVEAVQTPEPVKEEIPTSFEDDEAIKNSLRQCRKVRELCKFFEQQAKN